MPAELAIATFQPLAWVNEYTRPGMPINEQTFDPILQFFLMWNLFERDACGNEANPPSIEKAVQSSFAAGKLNLGSFAEHLQYFKCSSVSFSAFSLPYKETLAAVRRLPNNLPLPT